MSEISPKIARNAEIDRLCDALESQWRSGQRVALERLLRSEQVRVASDVLQELLLTEWECRLRLHDEIAVLSYLARFPLYAGDVIKAWHRFGSDAFDPLPDRSLFESIVPSVVESIFAHFSWELFSSSKVDSQRLISVFSTTASLSG